MIADHLAARKASGHVGQNGPPAVVAEGHCGDLDQVVVLSRCGVFSGVAACNDRVDGKWGRSNDCGADLSHHSLARVFHRAFLIAYSCYLGIRCGPQKFSTARAH